MAITRSSTSSSVNVKVSVGSCDRFFFIAFASVVSSSGREEDICLTISTRSSRQRPLSSRRWRRSSSHWVCRDLTCSRYVRRATIMDATAASATAAAMISATIVSGTLTLNNTVRDVVTSGRAFPRGYRPGEPCRGSVRGPILPPSSMEYHPDHPSSTQRAWASSSRSQVAGRPVSTACRLAWQPPSLGVRGCPPLAVAVVTHLVTRPLAAVAASGYLGDGLDTETLKRDSTGSDAGQLAAESIRGRQPREQPP